MFFDNPLIIDFVLNIAALLTAITVHEAAHAYMADRLGDITPRRQGRLTLNPLAHLDTWGTLVLFLTGFRFGWGKPVQFNPLNLQNPKKDAALISLAGPASNILIVSILSIVLKLSILPISPILAQYLLKPFITLNIALAVFNLIPMHPLDGGKILVGVLPPKDAYTVDRFMNQYGMFILLILILPVFGGIPLISIFLSPIIQFLHSIFLPASGLPWMV